MATIDSNIALGVKPLQVENPMNQYAAMSQIQNAQNQNALAQYQLSSAKRAEEGQNALSKAYQKAYNPETNKVDNSVLSSEMANSGFGHLLPKIQQDILAREKEAAAIKKTTVETTGLEFKQKMEKANKAISDIAALNSPQEAIASIDTHLANGDIDQSKADMLKTQLTQAPNFSGWKKSMLINIMDAKDQLQVEHNGVMESVAKGNLAVNQGQLKITQDKANREQTMGTIPAGYRLAADGKTLEAMPGGPTTVALPPKEIQKRETAFPQATSAVKAIETKSDSFINDLKKLRDHPGLNQITGIAAGRLPAFTSEGRAAQALYDKIVAKGGFQALQDLRDASKTGGALGNVSNQEGKQLTASFAAINRVQDAKDVRAAIDQAIGDVEGTKTRVREAYNQTYEYKNGANTTAAPVTPVTPTPTNPTSNKLSTDVTTPDGKVITFPTPEAAALFKQKVGIQ
jgi:hypothetical protein